MTDPHSTPIDPAIRDPRKRRELHERNEKHVPDTSDFYGVHRRELEFAEPIPDDEDFTLDVER